MKRFVACLGVWSLGSGGCALAEFLGTKDGSQAAKDAGEGIGGVLTNPANPLAWVKLLGAGATLAAGGLGLYHSPKAVKAAGRAAKAVKRRFTKAKPEEAKA